MVDRRFDVVFLDAGGVLRGQPVPPLGVRSCGNRRGIDNVGGKLAGHWARTKVGFHVFRDHLGGLIKVAASFQREPQRAARAEPAGEVGGRLRSSRKDRLVRRIRAGSSSQALINDAIGYGPGPLPRHARENEPERPDVARVVVPGGTGYLGRALTERLVARGDEVVVLTRGPGRRGDGYRMVTWDGCPVGAWGEELEGAQAVVHLSGRRVDTRATKRNVDDLISSRVQPVRVLGEALRACSAPPPTWVQSSSLPRPVAHGDRGLPPAPRTPRRPAGAGAPGQGGCTPPREQRQPGPHRPPVPAHSRARRGLRVHPARLRARGPACPRALRPPVTTNDRRARALTGETDGLAPCPRPGTP